MKMYLIAVFSILGFGLTNAFSAVGTADIDPQDTVNANVVADQDAPLLKFKVKEDNVTCLLAEFSGKIVGQFTENVTSTILVNGTRGEGSHCGEAKEKLSVVGFDGSILDFTFDQSGANIVLSTIKFTLNNVTYESNHTKTLYTVPVGNSFKCDSGISVDLVDEKDQSINFSLKSMRFDAFRKTQTDEYEADSICSADAKNNKTVPMIIAFVLGGMVVIMLVGYIILRRRENKSVYQSV